MENWVKQWGDEKKVDSISFSEDFFFFPEVKQYQRQSQSKTKQCNLGKVFNKVQHKKCLIFSLVLIHIHQTDITVYTILDILIVSFIEPHF